MQKNIGLFGGSFDPIHLGHLNLALELKEKRQLDEVWFIPACMSPFKIGSVLTPAAHRLEMLRLALKDFPNFYIKDLELSRTPPSYTIDTIRLFCQLNPQNHYFWLMGEDHLLNFKKWHQWQEIIEKVTLLIGSRFELHSPKYRYAEIELEKAVQSGWTKTRLMDISGTELRQRLAKKLICSHLLPSIVLQYIKQNQLYELKG